MENQHRKITGYRELSETEINLMNEIKALGQQVESLIIKMQQHIVQQRTLANSQTNESDAKRLDAATPERFAAMAKTEFQTGLMYLTRAIAQPTTF